MSLDTSQKSDLGDTNLAQYVAAHWARLKPLKQFAGEEFEYRDLPEHLRDRFDKLVTTRVLEHGTKDVNNHQWSWQVNPKVLAYLDRYIDDVPSGPLTPCHLYHGFTNLRDGGFKCAVCGEEFEREEFVQVDS